MDFIPAPFVWLIDWVFEPILWHFFLARQLKGIKFDW
jgi:hypothetical protein